ncbi:MAG TPA: membrane protein insertase YidC [Acidimicrobiales bacterium]|nr:membrane protein insertase YidC [Acidimicrobiales bacterium]
MFGFLAQLLNWCYSIWPNYLGMVVIFTFILMVVITPFTVKGMRSAAEMSRLQPEIKKLQDQYKNDRIKQNEEMQALFKEHGVNPLGGCLPTLLPLPIFFIVFRLLERLNGHKTGAAAPLVRLFRGQVGGAGGYVAPHYLAYHDKLTQHIIHDGGHLKAFGMDLALTARAHHSSVGAALPYYILILVMTGSQYWQQRQINQRNPQAANANPQMKMTMQLFPAFYALISLNIPATVVFYLLISGLFRMAQNSLSYRYDPVLKRASQPLPAGAAAAIEAKSTAKGAAAAPPAKRAASTPQGRKPAAPAPPPAKAGGFMERLRAQAAEAKAQSERSQQERAKGQSSTGGGRTTPRTGSPGGAPGRGGPAATAGNGRGGGKAAKPPAPRPERGPEPARDEAAAEAPPAPPSVEEQIAATEAEIDAAIEATGTPADDGGNGSPPPRTSSPIRVTRPPGRGPAPKGRRPRPGQ